MTLITYNTLHTFFENTFADLKCQPTTKAYIVSIYDKYKTSNFDLSDQSITILYGQARQNNKFEIYQNLGDWIFFINTTKPHFSNHTNKEYYDTVARLSYYSCYRLINKKWQLFEELADNFINIEQDVKLKLQGINNQILEDKNKLIAFD